MALGGVGVRGFGIVADDFLEEIAEGFFVVGDGSFPGGDLRDPFGALLVSDLLQVDEEAELFGGERDFAQFFGEDGREFFTVADVVGVVVEARDEAIGFFQGFLFRDRLGRGVFDVLAQGREPQGLGMFFFEKFFACAGNLIQAQLSHAGEVRAGESLHEEVERGAGAGGIFAQLQMPIGEFVAGDRDLDRLHAGVFADVDDDLRGIVEAFVLRGVKFCEHHPSVEIVFFAFELLDDFEFGIVEFPEFHFGDGFGIKRHGHGTLGELKSHVNRGNE